MLEKMIQMNSYIVLQREDAEEKLSKGEQNLEFSSLCYRRAINILYYPERSQEEFENFLFNFMFRYYPHKNIYLVYICYPDGKQVSTFYVRDKKGKYSQESTENRVSDEKQWKKVILAIDSVAVFCMKNLVTELMNLEKPAEIEEESQVEEKVLTFRNE